MNNQNLKKILFLDALFPIGVLNKFTESLVILGCKTTYIDIAKVNNKKFYKIKRFFKSFIKKFTNKKEYFYYPKTDNKKLKKIFYNVQPDVVIIAGMFYHYIEKKTLISLKKTLGFKLFLLETDCGNILNKRDKVFYFFNQLLPLFDHIFSCSKNMAELMKELGTKNVSFFPFGFQIDLPVKNKEKIHDLCFLGMPEMRRIYFLERLKDFNIKIYGTGWKNYKPLLSKELYSKCISKNIWGEELNQFLGQTKIILNITTTPWHSIDTSSHLRVLEALALQGFILTDYCDELEELFNIGKEIETYRSSDELLEKVSYYLAHDHEREKIAEAGHKKFLEKFTWEKRAEDFLNQINLLFK